MLGCARIILLVGLAMAAGGCAGSPPAAPATAPGGLGENFTNSQLRVSLYQWSAGDPAARNLCLKNSLVIFALLQECSSTAQPESMTGGELTLRSCRRSGSGRSAEFLVHPSGHEPWDMAIGFDVAAQQFSIAASPAGAARD